MTTDVVRRLSPEEEELFAKREQLVRLEAELAERELALASLKGELAAFEGLYLRIIGVLYAELDEWNAGLAEMLARQAGTPEARAGAAEARSRAQESYSEAHSTAAEVQPFSPSPELKSFYREAAKRVHPDTAADEKDRLRRERLMKEVNAAYAAGDEDALRRILTDLETSPDAVQGFGVGADLVRVIRQLRQVSNRIEAIESEIARLSDSDIGKLKAKAVQAETEGRDLLAEMAATLQGRVNVVRQQFDAARAGAPRND
jgi:hypothetical protein